MFRNAFTVLQFVSVSADLSSENCVKPSRRAAILSVLVFALVAISGAEAQTSSVYGYTYRGTTYQSLEHAEVALQNDDGQHSAGLGFPITLPSGGWTMDYRPLGALVTQIIRPAQSISEPYYMINAGSWPPTSPAPQCVALNNACFGRGWCTTPEEELARVTCQANATYPVNGCIIEPGYPAAGGEYPSPIVPNNLQAQPYPAIDPANLGRKGGALTFISGSCTPAGCSDSKYIDLLAHGTCPGGTASLVPQTADEASAAPSDNGPLNVLNRRWPLMHRKYAWCAPGLDFDVSAGPDNPCTTPKFKRFIEPSTPKQHDQCTEGNPCAPGNGNKEQEELDFKAGNIEFKRYYNSLRELRSYSFFDANWNHSFSQRILAGAITDDHYALTPSATLLLVQNERGHAETFKRVSSGVFRSVVHLDKVLFYSSGNEFPWAIAYPGSKIERYDNYGRIREIVYPDDYSKNLSIAYVIPEIDPQDPSASLHDWNFYVVDHVSDISGRGIRFVYDAETLVFPRVSEVLPIGSTSPLATYTYDSLGRLWKVQTSTGFREYWYGEEYKVANPELQKLYLTTILDENRDSGTYTYDLYGRVTSSMHVGNAGKVQIYYASDSRVRVTRQDGVIWFDYRASDAFRRASGVEEPDGFSSTILNSEAPAECSLSDERICKSIDKRGITTRFEYNTLFRTATIEADGQPESRRTEIDRFGSSHMYGESERRVKNSAGAAEKVVSYTRNARGQVLSRTELDPLLPASDSRITTFAYCEQVDVDAAACPMVGLLVSVDGPRTDVSDVTSFTYRMADDSGCTNSGYDDFENCKFRKSDLWYVTNALGQINEYSARDVYGNLRQSVDSNGTITDLTYNTRGWLLSRTVRALASGVSHADDATLSITYDPAGNVVRTTRPDGTFLRYTYDGARRLIKITDAEGNYIDYCPNGIGSTECLDTAGNRRVEYFRTASGVVKRLIRRTFGELSRLTELRNSANQLVTKYPIPGGYDPNGNATLSVDGLGVKTHQEYDPLNRLTTTIQDYLGSEPETANASMGYQYDTRNNLRQVTDPDGLNTIYDYDGLNNLTGLHSPDTGDTTYTYDSAGNRVTQTDARNVTSTYTYDALNRLVTIAYPTTAKNLSFSYDQPDSITGCIGSYAVGRLTRMTDETGTTTYCYDRRGNILRKVQVTALDTLTLTYAWTLADRLASITYPSGRIISYSRNGIGQITSVTMQPSAGATVEVLISSASYYPFGPLNVLTYGNGRSLAKTYDGDYAIDSVASSDPNGLVLDFSTDVMGNIINASDTAGATTPTRQYAYDDLYRLTQVTDGIGAMQEDYAYSKTGDRTRRQLGPQRAQVYAYVNGTHHLDNIDGNARSYDANGNTTLNPDTLSSTFTYDDRNRLEVMSGSPQGLYRYNARGERLIKQWGFMNFGLKERVSSYDEQGKLVAYLDYEYDNRGRRLLKGSYDLVYLDDLPVAMLSKGKISYLETDHLGTPRLAVDSVTHAEQWSWDFFADAFGANDAIVNDGKVDLPLRYPGQQYDSESGLHYNYFRDYEPGTGRYVESDPIGLLGGAATFVYATSNPLRNIDMLGLVPACHSGCNHRWDTCLITCRSLFPTPLIRCTKDKRECNNESTTTQWYISTQRNWLLYTEMSCNEFDAWYRRYNPEPPSA
jgi:RHS repeat-associated protein